MTRVLLVRCASHERAGTLLGRNDAVGLSRQGIIEATAVALRLAQEGVTCIQSSPQRRAHEMAALAAARTGLDIVTVPALDDMDFGRWSGTPLIELERNDQWCAWMRDRESRPSPGGESFSEVQKRIMKHLTDTFLRCPGETVAMITHAEPMRMAILEQRSLPLGAYAQITIAPASLFEIGDETRMPYFAAVA